MSQSVLLQPTAILQPQCQEPMGRQGIFTRMLYINEKAISLLRKRQYKEAAHLFQRAIQHAQEQEYDNDEDEYFNHSAPVLTVKGALATICEDCGSSDAGSFELYSNAFTLVCQPAHHGDCGSAVREQDNLLHCVMFYNLGLALQLEGMVTGQDRYSMRSIHAYETALGLIGQLERDPFVQTMELGTLNNCAHIHYRMFQSQEVHACLRLMKNTLYEITDGWSFDLPEQVTHFSTNILMNANHFTRQAPAA
mmetsp:Transcript_5325/g.10948  ORF Transcript_5325/g.10948 Transcript_5325/m.10948 type:complete len:251 (-) Transcript_5325:48-800(-)